MHDHAKGNRKGRAGRKANDVKADLIAVVVAVINRDPCVLTIGLEAVLPSGPFELAHRSLQSGVRVWVEQRTGQPLGYIEQLYTFADRDRIGADERAISISYLALTREEDATSSTRRCWGTWYDYFPWEDHRSGTPAMVGDVLRPRLFDWAHNAADSATRLERRRRAGVAFGFDDRAWNEELALQRYELLYEAGLVEEATRDHGSTALVSVPGRPMIADHRRILATGIARLRSKIKYRPVVFELMPPVFTLLQLQRTVEALAGRLINKPNFRRLVEQQELVEETGETSVETGGRPAKLYRFRHAVLDESIAAGTKLPLARG
ncbi:membrane protein [Mesorhizobium sp. WSM3224]|uniref:NUDIX hydrolase n=1 Tax=Mesorhizobium sp. WSM3224 TaxID=1040986 RepID=UPI00040C1DB0|nr:membrane protein [Mesorhizobium sp. WSM3224]